MEHLHCLSALNADMSIAKAMQLIKTHWANTGKLTRHKLEWADEYFAVSVSESMIDKVRDYIRNQEEHNKRTTFQSEYEEFIKKYGFEYQGLAKYRRYDIAITPLGKAASDYCIIHHDKSWGYPHTGMHYYDEP